MKYRSLIKLIIVGFGCALIATSCTKEGPMGPAGADGTDGTNGTDGKDGADGNVTCLVCHSTENFEAKKAQFWMSAHNVGAIAVDYAGGRASCAPCHSHELFVQTMTTGSVAGNITNPSAWKCSTCHGIHKNFEGEDYALRASDPINPIFDASVTMDLNGNSNLCAICHQSRRAEPNVTNPGETFRITNTHYGPHHGAQANVVAGMGFAEIQGPVEYPVQGNSNHLNQASCVGCHMADFNSGQGGHSFIPSLKACNDCHGANSEDFNYGGVQSEVHEMLVELRDQLVHLGVVEYGEEYEYEWNPETNQHDTIVVEAGYHPHPGTYPMVQVQAFFNWIGLEEDRSLGVHNPKYVKALLRNSIEALKGETASH